MDLLPVILDFLEEHWVAFIDRCEGSGLSESEVEKYIEELKKINN